MRRISLCTPVWGRYELTELLLRERVKTFAAARELGTECRCVVIGDDRNLVTAEALGFDVIEAPNQLGRKYNDGHQWAVEHGMDVSLQANSDQVFDPRLLAELAASPLDSIVQTRWLTAVHPTGRKAITTWNRFWSMTAYGAGLLDNDPRPCPEDLMSLCDTGTREGVERANPGAPVREVSLHPFETIQFESGIQLTPWSRHVKVALHERLMPEVPLPLVWRVVREQYGDDFHREIRRFYGQ